MADEDEGAASTSTASGAVEPTVPRAFWAWPGVVLAVLAVAGQLFGPFGAASAGIVALWTVVIVLGRGVISRRALLIVSAACVLVLAAVALAWTTGIREFGTERLPARTHDPAMTGEATDAPAPSSTP